MTDHSIFFCRNQFPVRKSSSDVGSYGRSKPSNLPDVGKKRGQRSSGDDSHEGGEGGSGGGRVALYRTATPQEVLELVCH